LARSAASASKCLTWVACTLRSAKKSTTWGRTMKIQGRVGEERKGSGGVNARALGPRRGQE
jgi:hypothetical protein